jgi:amino acid adenylation domain-containing protein
VTALEQSLNEIVRRHESLRTTFSTVEAQPVQIIVPPLAMTLPIVDLREIPEAKRAVEARRLALEEARQPFDLAQGPLLRATLLRLYEEEYVLLLTMHHIVSDGWSMGVLYRELAVLYDAFYTEKPSPLPELPIQYADFAIWQRQWLQGERLESLLSYWKGQLDEAAPVLDLPTDRPRPPRQTFRGARQALVLPKHLTAALKALSWQEEVTLFMTLLAAFKVLLSRYTGQDDIIVGSPIAGRTQTEVEGLIGFFVNTLVLRTDLSGIPSFREVLRRVREVCLEAYTHQDLPFEKLIEELHPQRDLSRNPLFQVLFILQNAPRLVLELPGLAQRPLEVDSGTAKFDVTLSMVEEAEGLRIVLEYNSDLFDAATIHRMLSHYRTLLEGIVADPDQLIARLPLLPEAERDQLLMVWNKTLTDYAQKWDQRIHQWFEAQVEQTPDAVAVVFGDAHLTYRELNRRANQLAHHLQALGVGPEVLVGVCLERSIEMMVCLLGILKAGGAYVPLDPNYPQERLAFILHDARVAVLLTQQRLVERLPMHNARLVCCDTAWPTIAQEHTDNPVRTVAPDNLAYVIYTSGSTGTPKGVLGLHRGAVNRFTWMWETYPFAAAEVCCQRTSLNFVDSVWEIFGPLLQGIPIVIMPDEIVQDPPRLLEHLAAHHVTRIVLVPSLLRVLLDTAVELQQQLPDLKIWITSGEALPRELCQQFHEQLPQRVLLNLYGASEVAADSTWYDTREGQWRPGVPIGRPIANTQIYLLDRALQPVPIGVPGELHVGGIGLARGYLNHPELAAERFIPHPFSRIPGARLYKTGDVARYRPDGNIEYLGRLDHQVKLRGIRIELGEVEAALGQHPAVRDTVVMVQEDVPGDQRLVAYVIPQSDPPPSIALRSFLQQKLPEYMVPSAFVILAAFPLTPNGKVNRQALPAPTQTRSFLEGTFIAPRTPVEEVIAGIWASTLGLEHVDIYDNFFELGGHSLLAARIVSQLRSAFAEDIPLRRFFECPTVAELAEVLLQHQIAQVEDEELARMLDEVERLSPEESPSWLTNEAEC